MKRLAVACLMLVMLGGCADFHTAFNDGLSAVKDGLSTPLTTGNTLLSGVVDLFVKAGGTCLTSLFGHLIG